MPLLSAYIVPHPPLAVPEVGKGQEESIPETMRAYREIADEIARQKPDTIILVSPHNRFCRDFFYMADGSSWASSFRDFRVHEPVIRMNYDEEMVQEIAQAAEREGIPAGNFGEALIPSRTTDHGSLVPLYFLAQATTQATAQAQATTQTPAPTTATQEAEAAGTLDVEPKVVRLSITSFSHEKHREFGRVIGRYLAQTPKRVVFVASGDLSHRLLPEGPYGLSREAPAFEEALVQAIGCGDFDHVVSLKSDLCEEVGECGIRGFCILGGVLDGNSYTSEVLSHEATFGVGYLVASFHPSPAWPKPPTPTSTTLFREGDGEGYTAEQAMKHVTHEEDLADADADSAEDSGDVGHVYVCLARRALEVRLGTGKPLELTGEERMALPKELTKRQAACFVSLHEKVDGSLRGCIGTIRAMKGALADEIMQNAVSAALEDPRFPPVEAGELAGLELSVDVLESPEDVATPDKLDAKRFGVIVSSGYRRGLLLPDLPGVETVEEQLAIAKRKAGIAPDEPCRLQRFTVTRYTEGAEDQGCSECLDDSGHGVDSGGSVDSVGSGDVEGSEGFL